jgi:hypothetical protein
MKPFALTFGVACAALLPWPDAHAQQWKWLDATGRMTVSDRPPPLDVPAKSIISRPFQTDVKAAKGLPAAAAAKATPQDDEAPAAGLKSAATTPESAAEAKAQKQQAEAAAEAAAKRKATEDKNNEIKRDNCKSARNNLTGLENGHRMGSRNEKGEWIPYDDAARAAAIQRNRESMTRDCSG